MLDRAFDVKNIKDGAIPRKELMETIKMQMLGTRKTCQEAVQALFRETDEEAARKKRKKLYEDEQRRHHEEAEKIAANTITPIPQLGKNIDPEEAIDEFLKNREEYAEKEAAARIRATFGEQPFMIEETSWDNSKFFDAIHAGNSGILEYNMSHLFFEQVAELLNELGLSAEEAQKTPAEVAESMKILIDLLLISYARAEANFDGDSQMSAEEFIDYIRGYWGQYLQNYVKTWISEGE